MLQLISGSIPDVGRSTASAAGASSYAATRTNVETPPVTAGEAAMHAKARRQGDRRTPSRRPQPEGDKNLGQNLDMEV